MSSGSGPRGLLGSGCGRWAAAVVFTLPAIKPSFGSAAGANLNDGSARYYSRSNPLRRFALRRRPLLFRSNSQYRPKGDPHPTSKRSFERKAPQA